LTYIVIVALALLFAFHVPENLVLDKFFWWWMEHTGSRVSGS
jgi:nitric oxide reductase subunit B